MSRRKTRSAKFNAAKILLACVTRGQPRAETIHALRRIERKHPTLDPTSYVISRHSVTVNRNMLADEFQAGPWDALIMVDDDVIVPERILGLCDNLDEYGVVGAAVPTFDTSFPVPVPSAFYGSFPDNLMFIPGGWLNEGLVEVDLVGAGCVAIHRRVIEALEPPWFKDDVWRSAGEDFLFCERARQAGFKVAVNFDLTCDHLRDVSLLDVAAGLAVAGGDEKEQTLLAKRKQALAAKAVPG